MFTCSHEIWNCLHTMKNFWYLWQIWAKPFFSFWKGLICFLVWLALWNRSAPLRKTIYSFWKVLICGRSGNKGGRQRSLGAARNNANHSKLPSHKINHLKLSRREVSDHLKCNFLEKAADGAIILPGSISSGRPQNYQKTINSKERKLGGFQVPPSSFMETRTCRFRKSAIMGKKRRNMQIFVI